MDEQARIDAANQAAQESQSLNEPQAPAPEQPVEQPAQPAEPAVPESTEAPVAPEPPVEQPTEAPAAPAPEEDYNVDPIPTFNIPPIEPAPPVQQQQPQPQTGVPPLNPQDFADQYGNVDMQKFAQAMSQRDQQLAAQVSQQVAQNVLRQTEQLTSQQILAMRQEERAWKAAEKAYPDLESNKELRDLVHNTRINYVANGAKMTPKAAADKIFKYVNSAKQQGAQEATTSVKVQASAHLESASNTSNESAVAQRDYARDIGHKTRPVARQARESLLKDWIKEGKIQLPS